MRFATFLLPKNKEKVIAAQRETEKKIRRGKRTKKKVGGGGKWINERRKTKKKL